MRTNSNYDRYKIFFFLIISISIIIVTSESAFARPILTLENRNNYIAFECTNVKGYAFLQTGETYVERGVTKFTTLSFGDYGRGGRGGYSYLTPGTYIVACFDGIYVPGRGAMYTVSLPKSVTIGGTTTTPTPPPPPSTPSPNTYWVRITKTGDGTGQVNGDGVYNEGSTVTLRADATYGSTFVSWSYVTCSQGNTNRECTVTVTRDINAMARFDLNDYTLTLSKSGSGTITGGGISTSSTSRTVQLPHGQLVTVNAQPSSGYSFSHWNGDCTGSGICQFNMQRDMGVHANFIKDEGTLYLATTGTGYGQIQGAGTTCNTPSICPVTVNVGQPYYIIATANPGSQLTKLEGCTLTSSNKCTITIPEGSTIRTVTATFDRN